MLAPLPVIGFVSREIEREGREADGAQNPCANSKNERQYSIKETPRIHALRRLSLFGGPGHLITLGHWDLCENLKSRLKGRNSAEL